jgi:putative tryptophan/tyrosine transport system substrate-binding protein
VPKRLQLIRDLIPGAKMVAMLVNPDARGTPPTTAEAQAAAQMLGFEILLLNARVDADLPHAFATLAERRAAALVITPDPYFNVRAKQSPPSRNAMQCPRSMQFPSFPRQVA